MTKMSNVTCAYARRSQRAACAVRMVGVPASPSDLDEKVQVPNRGKKKDLRACARTGMRGLVRTCMRVGPGQPGAGPGRGGGIIKKERARSATAEQDVAQLVARVPVPVVVKGAARKKKVMAGG